MRIGWALIAVAAGGCDPARPAPSAATGASSSMTVAGSATGSASAAASAATSASARAPVAHPRRSIEAVAWSPAGRVLTVTADGAFAIDLGGDEPSVTLLCERTPAHLRWSRDGARVVWRGPDGDLVLSDPTSGKRLFADDALCFARGWLSHDHHTLWVTTCDGTMVWVDGETGITRAKTHLGGAYSQGATMSFDVRWSPTDRVALAWADVGDPELWSGDRGERRRPVALSGASHVVSDATWHPAGASFVVATGDGFVAGYDARGRTRWTVEPGASGEPARDVSYSADGTHVAFVDGARALWTLDAASGKARQTLATGVSRATWSPAEARIAWVGEGGAVHVAAHDGSGRADLDSASPEAPTELGWSGDGRRLLLRSVRSTTWLDAATGERLGAVPSAENGGEVSLRSDGGVAAVPGPDATLVRLRDGATAFVRVDLDAGRPGVLVWTLDGRWAGSADLAKQAGGLAASPTPALLRAVVGDR